MPGDHSEDVLRRFEVELPHLNGVRRLTCRYLPFNATSAEAARAVAGGTRFVDETRRTALSRGHGPKGGRASRLAWYEFCTGGMDTAGACPAASVTLLRSFAARRTAAPYRSRSATEAPLRLRGRREVRPRVLDKGCPPRLLEPRSALQTRRTYGISLTRGGQ